MLEIRKYTKAEMTEMFGTRDIQGLRRKLERYNVDCEVSGRGQNAVFTINRINDPFKVYCITELGYDGATDFRKLLYFLYYFFNDEEFMAMPDEVKETRMRAVKHDLSRQTIAGYISKLDRLNMIDRNTNNFIYYFAYKGTQRITDKAEYLKAWHDYWNDIDNGISSWEAICSMRANHGGVARKQAVPEINGIYNEKIEYLLTLIYQAVEDDIEEKN